MRLVTQAQEFISKYLSNGAIALDLTCGNGKDTLFLAKKVGNDGLVYAIDIQQKALEETRKFLTHEDCIDQTTIISTCHSEFPKHIHQKLKGRISAIMLNLGYLPQGIRERITQPETTIAAISHAYSWLSPKGGMSILAYRAHPGGQQENLAVKNLILENRWNCTTEYGNQKKESPILYMISKNQRD